MSKKNKIACYKYIAINILLGSLLLFLSSCCTKKYCMGFDEIQEIQLLDFSPEETDSITLETFDANTNFTSRIDSTFQNGQDGKIRMPERVNLSTNYKITVLSTGQVYKITDIAIKKEECNCP